MGVGLGSMTLSLSFRKAFSTGHVDPSSYPTDRPSTTFKASSAAPRKSSSSTASSTSTSTLRAAPPPPTSTHFSTADPSWSTRPLPLGSLGKSRVGKLGKDFGSLRSGRRLFGSIGTLEKCEEWVVLPRHLSCPPTPTTAMGQNQTKPAPSGSVPRTLSHSASTANLKSTLVRPRLTEPPVVAPVQSTLQPSSVPRAIPRIQNEIVPALTPGAPHSFAAPRDNIEEPTAGPIGKKSLGLAGRLARKRSRRPRTADAKPAFGHGSKAKGSYSDDLARFEASVLAAESRTGQHQNTASNTSIPHPDTARSKRHSLSDPPSIKMGHTPRPSTAGNEAHSGDDRPPPFGHTTTKTTRQAHATHHRRSSNSSVVPEKSSIKSSRRAELEWRARVAALTAAHGSPRNSVVEGRGPVPPKRARSTKPFGVPVTPYAGDVDTKQDISLSSSLESQRIVTPPHASTTGSAPSDADSAVHTSSDEGDVKVGGLVPRTPARSFQSGKSFDTLGFHRPPPPSSAALELTPRTTKDHLVHLHRAVDVPRSVGSLGHSISPIPARLTRDGHSGPRDHAELVERMKGKDGLKFFLFQQEGGSVDRLI